MNKYHVALMVVYPSIVEANSKEEAYEKAIQECPYDAEYKAEEIEKVVTLEEGE